MELTPLTEAHCVKGLDVEEKIDGLSKEQHTPTHEQAFSLPSREGARQRQVERQQHDGVEGDFGHRNTRHLRVGAEIGASHLGLMILNDQAGHPRVFEGANQCLREAGHRRVDNRS